MLNSADRICATRAMKNVRYLQRLAPHIMPAVEPPEGFGSIIPLPILAARIDSERFERPHERLSPGKVHCSLCVCDCGECQRHNY